MALNRFLLGEREAVVHQSVARAQTPRRRRAHRVGRIRELGRRLHRDAVTGSDVVQQEVAVRMEGLVA